METVNSQILGWWRQFRMEVAAGIPFLQTPASLIDTGTEDAGDKLTREDEERLAQMESSLGRLFASLSSRGAFNNPFVLPSPTFRARLKQALLTEHRQRLAQRSTVPVPQEGSNAPLLERGAFNASWRWSLAASVPLVIGVLAFLWRRSQRSDGQLVSLIGGQ